MPAPIDITGKIYGDLTVVGRFGLSPKGEYLWSCSCSCGRATVASGYDLRSGHSSSCGCRAKESSRKRMTTHGLSKQPEFRIWIGMIRRCDDPTMNNYKNYGGRGIDVCKRWRDSFANFYEDLGPRPTRLHSIERIDNDRNYEPSNCKWATAKEQNNNRRKPAKRAEMRL